MGTLFYREKTRKTFEWCLDTFSLLSVLQYCTYRFMQSTMFVIYYSQIYKLITMGLLLAFGGARYLYVLIQKWKEKDREERKRFILNCGFAWILALPFFYVGWLHDYKVLIFMPICCMCLYDMKAEKVLRSFAYTISVCFVVTLICCLTGTVKNLTNALTDGRVVCAYGVINNSDFASYIIFIVAILWCSAKSKYKHIWFIVITLVVFPILYWYTDSKTVVLCGILFFVFFVWRYIEEVKESKGINEKRVTKIVYTVSVLAFPLMGIAIAILIWRYGAGDSWAIQLNEVLTDRLSVSWIPYQKYGLHPFGNYIEKMYGAGGTRILWTWTSLGYSYIDIAYAMLTIRYGWLISSVVAGLWVWMTIKAIRSGKKEIALSLMLFAIHGISEARILDINYNIFLAMPFCSFTKNEKNTKCLQDAKIGNRYKGIVAFVLGGIIVCFLGDILSWLRTFFAIKAWNSGTKSIYSIITCSILAVLLILLWKTTSIFLVERNRRRISAFVLVLICLAGNILAINGTINHTIKNEMERIENETTIIRSVEAIATQPVYAAEADELYKRTVGGLSKHIFSTDELVREPRGSIFVDSSVESMVITESGGKYTQISEKSGLYSFDSCVIDELEKNGFQWKPFYYGWQSCNLEDVAIFNNLKPGGKIQLNNGDRIITQNMEDD